MKRPLTISLWVLCLLMTVFGWHSSRPAVFLLWAMAALGTLVDLTASHRKKPVSHFRVYRLACWIVFFLSLGLCLFSIA